MTGPIREGSLSPWHQGHRWREIAHPESRWRFLFLQAEGRNAFQAFGQTFQAPVRLASIAMDTAPGTQTGRCRRAKTSGCQSCQSRKHWRILEEMPEFAPCWPSEIPCAKPDLDKRALESPRANCGLKPGSKHRQTGPGSK